MLKINIVFFFDFSCVITISLLNAIAFCPTATVSYASIAIDRYFENV